MRASILIALLFCTTVAAAQRSESTEQELPYHVAKTFAISEHISGLICLGTSGYLSANEEKNKQGLRFTTAVFGVVISLEGLRMKKKYSIRYFD